jgi:tyrosyl-tRNA synthetase
MGGASLIAELKDRGLIFNVTADDMGSILDNTFRPAELGSEGDGDLHTSPAVYCGFDPTAR